MTIDEFRINLDIGNPKDVLKANAKKCSKGYLFVDSDDGCCYLFGKDGKEKDINELTTIDNELFYDDKSLTKIVLPDSVKSIGKWAFGGCIRLTSIAISNSITSIKKYAFYSCGSFTSVTIPSSITSIGDYAFVCCDKLTSLVFKGKTFEKVKAIKNYPFDIDKSIIRYEA